MAGCQNRDVPRLRLATTASVENAGLLTAILPAFEASHGVKVDVIAVGSGRALNLLANGDVDAGLTRDPEAEQRAGDSGHIAEYRKVMFNDFVIVGPSEDPAHVRGSGNIQTAMQRIAASESPFVSRGDESGTAEHVRDIRAKVTR